MQIIPRFLKGSLSFSLLSLLIGLLVITGCRGSQNHSVNDPAEPPPPGQLLQESDPDSPDVLQGDNPRPETEPGDTPPASSRDFRAELPASVRMVKGTYILGPQDVIRVTVYAHDLKVMDVKVRISSQGTITLPLLGELRTEGKTLKELENLISESLGRDFFVNPKVILDIEQFRERKVFVLGQVKTPGEYDITGPKTVTIVQAISLAGGLTKGAALNSSQITRIVEGVETTIRIKLEDIIEDGKKKQDIVVLDGDIIYVPEHFF